MNYQVRFAFQTCFSLIVVFGAAAVAYTQQTSPPSLITVNGQAEVRVPPDEVLFTLEIESTDKDLLVAKNKTDESVRQVFAVARKHQISQDDVQTSYISVTPKYNTDDLDYEQQRRVKKEFVGYEVSKTTVIRLREISRFDELLSDILKAGVSKLGNLEFRDSKIRIHKDQARVMAIKAAREKAILLTREIGQSIGPAHSISEGGEGRFSSSNMTQNATTSISGDLSSSESSSFSPGLISITANVVVSFRLVTPGLN